MSDSEPRVVAHNFLSLVCIIFFTNPKGFFLGLEPSIDNVLGMINMLC